MALSIMVSYLRGVVQTSRYLTLTDKLLEYVNADKERLYDLYTVYNLVKSKIMMALPSIAYTFPHYSRHDITHVECVLDNIERIIGDTSTLCQLNLHKPIWRLRRHMSGCWR